MPSELWPVSCGQHVIRYGRALWLRPGPGAEPTRDHPLWGPKRQRGGMPACMPCVHCGIYPHIPVYTCMYPAHIPCTYTQHTPAYILHTPSYPASLHGGPAHPAYPPHPVHPWCQALWLPARRLTLSPEALQGGATHPSQLTRTWAPAFSDCTVATVNPHAGLGARNWLPRWMR